MAQLLQSALTHFCGGRFSIRPRGRVIIWGMALLLAAQPPASGQKLTWLGTLGGSQSVATDVSNDGLVVVGYSRVPASDSLPILRAFRWTPTGGMQDLGTLGGPSSEAAGVSADGSVIAGSSVTDDSVTTRTNLRLGPSRRQGK